MIARVLIGPLEKRVAEIQKLLLLHIGSVTEHPDVLYFSSDSKLGILEARKIKAHFSLKPYSAKGRIVAIEDGSVLTVDAQNALLKTLEELPTEAIIILGANSDASFLPTILSRCQVIRLQPSRLQANPSDIEQLLSSTTEKRFEYIENLKDKEQFLQDLINYFHQNLRSHLPAGKAGPGGVNVGFLKELLEAEKWAKQNVNIRAILEYLMLVMPN